MIEHSEPEEVRGVPKAFRHLPETFARNIERGAL